MYILGKQTQEQRNVNKGLGAYLLLAAHVRDQKNTSMQVQV